LRAANADRTLLVESGDFLYPEEPAPWGEPEKAAARAETIANAYRIAGYDAVLFGQRDYALGVAPLKKLAEKMAVPILGANVLDKQTGKHFWHESLIVQRGGLRIGLIGVIGLPREPATVWRSEVEVVSPIDVTRRVVAELRPQVDLIVLAANLDAALLKELLGQVPGIDFVLRSNDAGKITHRVEIMHDVPTACLFAGGQYVGRFDITFVEPKKLFQDLSERDILQRKIDQYQAYVTAMEKEAGGSNRVAQFFQGQTERLENYRKYRLGIADWKKELAKIKEKGNRYAYEMAELNDAVAPDPLVAAQVEYFVRTGQFGPVAAGDPEPVIKSKQ